MNNYGRNRVLEPRGYFPVSAWKLNNDREIYPDEIRVRVSRIKLEEASFRQLCNSCEYDFQKIKDKIFNITQRRGKLHNQLTDSGGICCGVVEEIGTDFAQTTELKTGDKIIGIASLTAIPLHINEIKSINYNYGQIEVDGYAIFFSASPIILMPEGISEEVLLSAYDESGSIAKAGEISKEGSRFLILGNNLLIVLLYAAAMRFSNGVGCYITVCLDFEETEILNKERIYNLLKPYVNSVHILGISSPMENYDFISKEEFGRIPDESMLYDTSIVCSNLMGIESIGVLLTKNHGNLFFTNLINNYNLVVLCAETLGKNINTISLEEYNSEFPQFTEKLLWQLQIKIAQIHDIYKGRDLAHKTFSDNALNYKMQNIRKIEGYAYGSKATEEMLEEVLNLAGFDCNALILGETGVGKERILDIIYKNSSRKEHPCIKINCSAISESLAESEFFGYEKGAFTGAKEIGKKGFFEQANNGILFLDEIGDLPLGIQAKLLRVLQEGQYYRVGGEKPVKVNVRVICATNRNIRDLVLENKFREDLYYRINICEINILPLRERIDDIEPLAEMFIKKYNDDYLLSKTLSIDAIDSLKQYSWPGNIRELENVIHKLVIKTRKNLIDENNVRNILTANREAEEKAKSGEQDMGIRQEVILTEYKSAMHLDDLIEKHEQAIIRDALIRYKTTRKAAEALGISQSQMMRKKKKYKL